MKNLRTLTTMAVLIALGVVCSYLGAIPMFGAKLFPAQAAIDVIAAVTIGPWFGGIVALAIALLRIALGTGSILAIPGSFFGAVLAGLLFRATRSTLAAMLGEVLGTGVIAAIVAYPMAVAFLHKAASIGLFFYVIPFGSSSLAGALLGGVVAAALGRALPRTVPEPSR